MIQLLGTYEYLGETIPAGAIVSVFDSATEAGLIAAKLALSSAGPTTWTPADRAYKPKTPVLFDAKTTKLVAQDERGIQALVSGDRNIRTRPVRVGYVGDSTANGWAITGSTPFDMRIGTQVIGASGTLDNNTNADKFLLPAFYQKAWLVANCGVSGDTTTQVLTRDTAAVSATRKAVTDLLDMAPDVVIVRIGSNDFNSQSSPIAQSVIDTAVANLTRIVRRIRSAGIPVIVEGVHGYAPPSGAAADIAARKAAMVAYNTAAAALCATDPLRLAYLDPVGLTADATGTYLPDLYETAYGIHLTLAGAVAVAQAEAALLRQWFGAPYGPRYPGINAIGSQALMHTTSSPSYGVLAGGFTIFSTNCTRQNAKVEEIDGRMWQTCEFVLTGASAIAQMNAPFTPSTYGIAANDVWGFEFDFLIQPVTPIGSVPAPSSLTGRVALTKTAAGTVQANALALTYPGYTLTTTGIRGKVVLPPMTISEASAALSDASSFMRLEMQTSANDGSVFRLGMSMPRAIKLGSDGYPVA